MIMSPFWIHQGLNARILAGKKLVIEVPRNEREGSFTRDSVADSVRSVMGENDDVSYKEKAKEMSAVFGDGELRYKYVDNFIQHLEEEKKYADA